MPVLIGTSGWQYRHWRDPSIRPTCRSASGLSTTPRGSPRWRATRPSTGCPPAETFEQWRARTPDGFVMAVKASRYLTHVRRLRDPAEPVRRMLDAFAGLGEQARPRCCSSSARDAGRPGCGVVPADRPAGSRRRPRRGGAARRLLVDRRRPRRPHRARRGAVLGRPRRSRATPLWRTADWGYLRFHEGDGDPWPRYTEDRAAHWADRHRRRLARRRPGATRTSTTTRRRRRARRRDLRRGYGARRPAGRWLSGHVR